jgi:hypothetical protein
MKGRRIYPNSDGTFKLERGDYIFVHDRWFARVPDERMNDMDLSDLSLHTITEHEDGTITVSPSIKHTGNNEGWTKKIVWHGFLERGVWRLA